MYEIIIENGDVSEKLHETNTNSPRRVSACQFTKGVNLIPSAEAHVYKGNPAYENLIERKTKARIVNTLTGKTAFEGRLLKLYDDGMESSGAISKKLICEGYLGYLCDSIQMYQRFETMRPGEVLGAMLDAHNAQVEEEKRIYLGKTISGDIRVIETDYKSTLEEIKRLIIQEYGGEISVRTGDDGKLYLDWTDTAADDPVSDTVIELADNMISLKKETDSSNIVTRLIPLGAMLKNEDNDTTGERLTIANVNPTGKVYIDDEEAMAQYGIIVGTVIFEDCEPGMEADLLARGEVYLKNNNRIKRSFRAEALDLSTIGKAPDALEEGKTYQFVNRMIPINEPLRIQKITTDIFKPYRPILEIGDKTEKITSIAARQAQLIEYELPKQKLDILASAKATSTALIKGGFIGYVTVNPDELLIMDHPDKDKAVKVWRFNMAGLGYSSTGYDGEYGLAITMDGAIVADFITAGVLRGLEILNGDSTFHVYADGTVEASAIHITGGSIHITTESETYDVIDLNCGDWHHQLSPLQWVLVNAKENFSILAQAGSMYFKDGAVAKATISSKTGEISCRALRSEGIVTCDSFSSTGAASCSDVNFMGVDGNRKLLSVLENRVAALESKIS